MVLVEEGDWEFLHKRFGADHAPIRVSVERAGTRKRGEKDGWGSYSVRCALTPCAVCMDRRAKERQTASQTFFEGVNGRVQAIYLTERADLGLTASKVLAVTALHSHPCACTLTLCPPLPTRAHTRTLTRPAHAHAHTQRQKKPTQSRRSGLRGLIMERSIGVSSDDSVQTVFWKVVEQSDNIAIRLYRLANRAESR